MNYQEPQIGDMVKLVGRSSSKGQYGLVVNVVEPNPNIDKPGWIDLMREPLYCVLLSDGEVMPVWKDSLRLLYHSSSV